MCEPITLSLLGSALGATASAGGVAALGAASFGTLAAGAAIGGSAALSAYGAYQQSAARKGEAKYQAQVAANNATMADAQAKDALEQGTAAVTRKGREYNQLRGKQVAELAAQGLDISSGTAGALLDDTAYFEAMDLDAIRTNAERQAWGAKVQSQNYRDSAAMLSSTAANEKPWLAAGTSLLSAGASVAPRWLPRTA